MSYEKKHDEQGEEEDSIVRQSDGVFIPIDPDNEDFKEYDKWVQTGNTIAPDPTYTLADAQTALVKKINATAKRLIYDKWEIETQLNIASGLFPELATQRNNDIARVISESNSFTADVISLATIAEVRAYTYSFTPII